jgi:hypothetical protein
LPSDPIGNVVAGIEVDDDANTTMKVTELKAQVASASYDVDCHAVAEAFVSRMLAVHGALRRADVRALLGDKALDEMRLPA